MHFEAAREQGEFLSPKNVSLIGCSDVELQLYPRLLRTTDWGTGALGWINKGNRRRISVI